MLATDGRPACIRVPRRYCVAPVFFFLTITAWLPSLVNRMEKKCARSKTPMRLVYPVRGPQNTISDKEKKPKNISGKPIEYMELFVRTNADN